MARGTVTYRLVIDSKQASDALKTLQSQVLSFGRSFGDELGGAGKVLEALGPVGIAAAAGVGALTVGATEAAKAIAETVAKTAEFGEHIEDLSKRTGVSTTALQEWGFAAQLSNTSLDAIANAANKMQKALYTSDEGFKRLGLSASQLRQLQPEEAFEKVAEAINALPSAAERAKAAMTVFGKSGAEMLPFIEDLATAKKHAEELGIVLSDDDIKAADAFKKKTDELGMAWEAFKRQIGAELIKSGAFDTLVTSLESLAKWVADNKDNIRDFVNLFGDLAKKATEAQLSISKMAIKSVGNMITSTPLGGLGVIAKKLFDFGLGADSGDVLGALMNAHQTEGKLPIPSAPKPPPPPPGLTDEQQKLLDSLTGVSAKEELKNVEAVYAHSKALQELAKGYSSTTGEVDRANITYPKFIALLEKLQATGIKLPQTFQAMLDAQQKLRLETEHGLVGPPEEEKVGVLPKMREGMRQALAAGAEQPGMFSPAPINIDLGFEKPAAQAAVVADKEAKAKQNAIDWNAALQQVSNTFNVLGISADSALGRILGGVTTAMAGIQGIEKSVTAFKSQVDVINTKNAPGGGGAGIGDYLKAASPIVAGVMQGISVVKGVIGMFQKPEWMKAADAVGKEMGVHISQQLSQSIIDQSKALGISIQSAMSLNLDKIMSETGKDPRTFNKQIIDLMNGVKLGSIPAKQGVEEIGKAFTAVQQAAEAAGSIGDASMRQIIARSKELGQNIPEITAYVKSELDKSVKGIGAVVASYTEDKGAGGNFLSGIQVQTAEQGKAQATVFSSVFWATVKEQGPVAASDAMRDSFQRLHDELTTVGVDPHAFDQMLAPIQRIMDLTAPGGDKGPGGLFRGAIEGAQGLQQALEGVSNAGYLTTDSFAAFENQAQAAFQQAVAGGATSAEALQAMAPLLNSIVSASNNYGITLDENTRQLIEQAKEAGVAFPIDPINRAADALERIADLMAGIAGTSGQVANNLGNFKVPSATPGGSIPINSEGYAEGSGGIVDFGKGTATILHGKEVVLTQKQAGQMMAGARSSVYAPNFSVTFGAGAASMKEEVFAHLQDIVDGNYRDFVRTVSRRLDGKR